MAKYKERHSTSDSNTSFRVLRRNSFLVYDGILSCIAINVAKGEMNEGGKRRGTAI